jgi:hypothetical protein
MPTLDRRLPGGDLAGPRLDDVTHDHVVDLVAVDTGLLQGCLDRQSAEVHGLEVLEGSAQLADRRARTADDD